eukprot:TRINITY_DN10559_c0_g1_i1.p1 TRINITY_DN10559_c0_g1~~TRINITY_DN10559_c0_g1_i1.p1  ORF type:complete len:321 (-),score=44.97 TRINITY_DN10559_c0_g1_i1:36-998(-)
MTHLYCPRCKSNNYTNTYIQTRTLDEAATLFYKCKECSKEWRPIKEYSETGIRNGLSLAMAITMPISQTKFDSTRTTGKVLYEGPNLDTLLEDRKSEYVTYTFHEKNIDEVIFMWDILLDHIVKGNIINIDDNGIVKYLYNKKINECKLEEIQDGKYKRGLFDFNYPEVLDIIYIPNYLKFVSETKSFKCFSIFKEDCIDKLKESEDTYSDMGVFEEVVGTNFHSMLKYYDNNIVINILKNIFMDTKVLNEEEAIILAKDMIKENNYIPIKNMSLSSPLEKMLYTGSLNTIREFVVNQNIDYLKTPLSISTVKKIESGWY